MGESPAPLTQGLRCWIGTPESGEGKGKRFLREQKKELSSEEKGLSTSGNQTLLRPVGRELGQGA